MAAKKKAPLKGRIIILSGPSGAGKTTLHDLLLQSARFRGKIVRSVSATTRKPRGREKNGREYFFLTEALFKSMIRRKKFLEWAKVFDNYYGTPVDKVRDVLKKGKSVLLCIDVQGGAQVKRVEPKSLAVFVKTPTILELRRRLLSRKTDTKESVALRLKTARQELKKAGKYDHVLVNDDLKRAEQELEDIVGRAVGGC